MKLLILTNHGPEDASARQRIHEYVPALAAAGFSVSIHPFTDAALFGVQQRKGLWSRKVREMMRATQRRLASLALVGDADVVMVHREAFPFGPPWLESWVARRARSFVYSFDDALYAPYPYAHGLTKRALYALKYGRNLAPVMRRAHAVVAGSETLADYARQHCSRVAVIPTAIDADRYRPARVSREDEQVVIGWIGSPSTSWHLKGIDGALRRVSRMYGERVVFSFVGDSALTPAVPGARVVAWCQERELADLQSFDIGLMPLDDSRWTRGKCAYKAVQYMAVGIPVVASPIGAASDVVRQGATGLLASTEDEWVSALSKLILDRALRQQLGAAGRAAVRSHYSLAATAGQLIDVLMNAARSGQTRAAPR